MQLGRMGANVVRACYGGTPVSDSREGRLGQLPYTDSG